MRNLNTLRLLVAANAIVCWTVFSGCNESDEAKQSSTGQLEIKKETNEFLAAQARDVDDARQALAAANSVTNTVDNPIETVKTSGEAELQTGAEPEKQTIEIPTTWKRLGKKEEIWIDPIAKEVIIAGRVCLNQGPLEMFICPQHTKEHESVISANATALQVHLALTALGTDPGKATSWDPEYRAAYGPTIQVTLKWQDKDTKKTKTILANQWIRDVKTRKAMDHLWVFGGSQFWEDPDTKEQVYYGDSGELICLSNFSTATIDLNVESSQSNAGLLFEAFTENIPPLGTKVYAIIKPGKRIEPVKQPAKQKDAQVAHENETIEDPTDVHDSDLEDQ